MEIAYITPASAININKQQIETYTPKEPHGVLNHGALESALMRGQQHHYYNQECDIFQIAGTIGWGVIKAHAFTNANKRTAFHITIATLLLNGYLCYIDKETAIDLCVQMANGSVTHDSFSDILRQCSKRFDIDNPAKYV